MTNNQHIIGGGKVRSSNLELYRIICMLMIVAHHYVVSSGLTGDGSPMVEYPHSIKTIYLFVFGMWGKTGIDCFLMITGYFMCKSSITIRKFIKLMLQIYLYKITIYSIFLFSGLESFSPMRIFKLLMPVWGFNGNFVSCFIGFWLTIPFWNILVHNMTTKQHQLLLILLLGMYSVLCYIPNFDITFNYVTWFGIIYLIASFIRLHPMPIFDNKRLWASLSIALIIIAVLSVVLLQYLFGKGLFLVSESNRLIAVAIAVTTFLWMKNISIPYTKWINLIGASTFGVLLIHANSGAMMQWLWRDTVDCVGHYSLPFWQLVGFSFGVCLTIFFTCIVIDRIRMKLLEEPFFKWYDKKPRFQKLERYLTEN